MKEKQKNIKVRSLQMIQLGHLLHLGGDVVAAVSGSTKTLLWNFEAILIMAHKTGFNGDIVGSWKTLNSWYEIMGVSHNMWGNLVGAAFLFELLYLVLINVIFLNFPLIYRKSQSNWHCLQRVL